MTDARAQPGFRVRIRCGFSGPLTLEQLDRCIDQLHLMVRFGFNDRPRYTDTGDGDRVETTYAHVIADLEVEHIATRVGLELLVVARSRVSAPVLQSGAAFVQAVLETCQLYYDLEEWASARLAHESAITSVAERVASYVLPADEATATWQLLNQRWGLGWSPIESGSPTSTRTRTPSTESAAIASWVGPALMEIDYVVIEGFDDV